MHLVSAWASRQRLVLGQEAVDGKGNEITATPLLLERLELEGALVTIDAIGWQREIAATIRRRGADDLLALKNNHPATAAEVRLYFDGPEGQASPVFETTDGDHGRIEIRRHRVSHDVGWLFSDRRYPDEPAFPGLAMIGMVEAEVARGGAVSLSRRYYLGSAPLSAAQFARAVRAHWGVENRLHWVMDVVFHDDLMRLRTGHGPANMAAVRHMALNLFHAIPGRRSLKVKRKSVAWNEDALVAAIIQTTH